MTDVFLIARSKISRSLIESYFGVSGAYWSRGEYWTLNPYRGDKHIGSFHISEDGMWVDHATAEGGDFINLVARTKNISDLEAAKLIAGGDYTPPERKEPKTKPKDKEIKVAPKYPIPEKIAKEFMDYAEQSFFERRFGKYKKTFAIRNIDNDILYFVVRYETEQKQGKAKKNTIPFYWGVDDKFYAKLPWNEKIPMYGVQKIKQGCRVLVVEGEKKAVIPCGDWVLVSPVGGSAKFHLADVEPLKRASEVLIWPDNDEPGKKAAETIYEIIPCENKSILEITDKPKSWDICDLDGDPSEFIEQTPKYKPIPKPPEPAPTNIVQKKPEKPDNTPNAKTDNLYFRALGWDDEFHYFMIKRERIIMTIPRQSFTSSKLLSIAPMIYWQEVGCASEKNKLVIENAQEWVQDISFLSGRFNTDKIRGAGVWIDGEHKIVNTGRELFVDGEKIHYDKFYSQYVYVSSEKYFGKIEGTPASSEQGQMLYELFKAQVWINPQSHFASLGWALISNFGGCLNWRPHIFVTGKIGSGKSWVLDNLIKPIVGEYAHYGSGLNTEPGIRRDIMQEPRPVVLDELKVKTKKDESNIQNILNLIRNSSSDASAKITMASPNGGTITFNVRSPFCLSSDQIPYNSDDMTSRIISCDLVNPPDALRKQHEQLKTTKSAKFMHVLNNPDIFRIRIFQRLQDIIDDIYWLQNDELGFKQDVFTFFNTNRKRANWSPLIVAVFHLLFDQKMTDDLNFTTQWLIDNFMDWKETNHTNASDEEGIIYALIESTVRVDTQDMTIGELLMNYNDYENKKYLGRMGIKINKTNELCIATNSDKIKHILKDKHYAENYDAQLRRNELCKNGNEKSKNVRFTEIGNRMARLFDWYEFSKKYLEGEDDGE